MALQMGRTIHYIIDHEEDVLRLTDSLRGRSVLSDASLGPEERVAILDTADVLKRLRKDGIGHPWLAGKTMGMIFQHPSTRTRTAFQAGMEQLGGQAIFLGAQDLQLKRGETIEDTAAIFSRYVDAVAARIADPADLIQFARGATVPVFNALTSVDHPLEALSDVFALRAHFGSLRGLTFAYLGDGNNVCHSLMLAMAAAGVNVHIACPPQFGPDPHIVPQAQAVASQTGAQIRFYGSANEAVRGADAVYTDIHESMGEQENPRKLMALAPYRVTQEVMQRAKPEAVFMHCLPLRRGQEVEPEVADGPQSIIFDQAEARLHVHKAVLLQVLHGDRNPFSS
jgi:ornithine carbamoyltransferase